MNLPLSRFGGRGIFSSKFPTNGKKVLAWSNKSTAIQPMDSKQAVHRPGGTGIPDRSNIMQVAIKTINENGLAQIAKFLSENTAKQFTLEMDRAALHAWAADAEFQMGEGNSPCIEISAVASIHGYTQEFEISAEGIDTEYVEIDE